MGSGVGNSGTGRNVGYAETAKERREDRIAERINALWNDSDGEMDNMPDRRTIREVITKAKVGDEITLYTARGVNSGNKIYRIEGILEDPVTYKKTANDEWVREDYGRSPYGITSDRSLITKLYENSHYRAIGGQPNTESRVEITGKYGKSYDGLRYAKGKYDIMRNGGNFKREKVAQEGFITEYDGVQYGVTKGKNGYTVTHIPTGLAIAGNNMAVQNLRSFESVSNAIKNASNMLKEQRMKVAVDIAEDEFKRTIRGDEKRKKRGA